MKSLLVKLGVVLIGLSIFGYAEVWGADWKYFGGTVLEKDEQAIIFYDAESVERLSDGNIRVWTKTFTNRSEFKEVQVKKEVIEKVADKVERGYYPPYVLLHLEETNYGTCIDIIAWEEAANYPYIKPKARVLFEINCKEKMIRTLSTILYNDAGVTSGSKGGKWDYISPETNGETLREILCKDRK